VTRLALDASTQAAIDMARHEAERIDAAVRLLVALGGEDEVRRRVVHERHDPKPAPYAHDLTMRMKPQNLALNALMLDGVRVWEGYYRGTDHGWVWRERWLHEGREVGR
jgi:hypothetical protein